ncbi:sigma-54-dependent Fis family transcriptional regulator [Clostridium beijerinckii]|jgi:transcriptional regulator of acetoin/glycerol metabolism|uniref:Sigma-54-dependent Fis family transcriptional regulator n=2 Tax=Clostridium beijerinckii TaxID=1520 RepID=A0A1S8QK55_CLOBE|nr:sigma-54-dependent Fis family transcriptional regulator [Clostridium beijerinckii]ABR33641.1 GAF modulated sigma54 specific transcriptional regulator, Fis family [Clostridium beijerinckii NCIMB 8052]AIU03829.1 Fis family GAF modulated sigma54 specific transcriptional regulator [Clostridium beijerinckii ATCC 35702]MBF7812059.1 sigma-54-dependent Fis family transcriptional regulator [Clostridium beijerinckii]NRT25086.1 transcriptional regulator of acetoin/glycerol metabolism [Clostridium beije
MENYVDFINKAWKDFISTGNVNPKVRSEIGDSWIRCMNYGVNPYDGKGHVRHSNIKELIDKNNELISVARPIMESIYSMVRGSGFALFLTDKDGYIVDVIGDNDIMKRIEELNFLKGELWSENVVGTNAIGTALYLGKPVQTIGAEHYGVNQHSWTCSASPIYDEDDNLIGCINMSGNYYNAHSHTLGIVTAAAQSIQKQMALAISYKLLNVTFDSISEGMIVINEYMKVKRINGRALKILNISLEEAMNMNINEVLNGVDFHKLLQEKNKSLNNIEWDFSINNDIIKCVINVLPLNKNGKSSGMVITFTEVKIVHKLVNKFVGYKAQYEFKDIMTTSKEMANMIAFAKKASKSDCNILIQGESGTGKELISQSIHNYSDRARGPFVAVNCASIPSELVESELFGYEKGAFTGASKEGHPGKFELADGGTIFLDEIGELPLDIQSKLLRVLDNGKIVRVGGTYEKQLNVRVIGATNRILKNEIRRKNFREDLYYRLSVMEIKTIPLRERKDDIDVLVNDFVQRLNIKNKNKIITVSKEYIDKLKKYDWDGNIRELKNVVERDYYLSEDEMMNIDINNLDYNNMTQTLHQEPINQEEIKIIPLDLLEENAIRDAIKKCDGNLQLTSKLLSIGRATLYRKIKKYHIDVSK